MFKIIKYSKLNRQFVIFEDNDYDRVKSVYDAIKTEEKLYGEDIFTYEIIEEKNGEWIGLSNKSDLILGLEREQQQ